VNFVLKGLITKIKKCLIQFWANLHQFSAVEKWVTEF